MRRQNVGACVEVSPYCFGLAKSAAADFSQASLMFSYFSLKMSYSPRAGPSVFLPLAALLLWADSLLHHTGLFVPACHVENVTNIGIDKILAPAKILQIFAKL
jgi:hypothetical protein